jgi:ABC-type branched-subunit amino acid transport system substrate-binding protein
MWKGLSRVRKNRKIIAAVIASIRDAEAILIFGPGDAKGELKKRLKRNNLSGRIAGLETVDTMTDRQIAAKVRKYFQK